MTEREEIRLEVLKALTILAIYDDQFRRGAISDLEGTLTRYGFVLNDQEMERVRTSREDVADMSDTDLVRFLTAEEEERISPAEASLRARW